MSNRGRKRAKYTHFLISLIKEPQFLNFFIKSCGTFSVPSRENIVYKNLAEILKQNGYNQSCETIYFCVMRHTCEFEQYLFDKSLKLR